MTTHIPINLLEEEGEVLAEKNPELFMEIKRWWGSNFEEILNDDKNKHLRI